MLLHGLMPHKTMARKQIPSAYHYRRSIFLTQILQRIEPNNWHEELLDLADHWHVTHDGSLEDCLQQLSTHVLEHGRDNWKG